MRVAQELDAEFEEGRERVRCELQLFDALDHQLGMVREQMGQTVENELHGVEGDDGYL